MSGHGLIGILAILIVATPPPLLVEAGVILLDELIESLGVARVHLVPRVRRLVVGSGAHQGLNVGSKDLGDERDRGKPPRAGAAAAALVISGPG
jgi:hypothetical protein